MRHYQILKKEIDAPDAIVVPTAEVAKASEKLRPKCHWKTNSKYYGLGSPTNGMFQEIYRSRMLPRKRWQIGEEVGYI